MPKLSLQCWWCDDTVAPTPVNSSPEGVESSICLVIFQTQRQESSSYMLTREMLEASQMTCLCEPRLIKNTDTLAQYLYISRHFSDACFTRNSYSLHFWAPGHGCFQYCCWGNKQTNKKKHGFSAWKFRFNASLFNTVTPGSYFEMWIMTLFLAWLTKSLI